MGERSREVYEQLAPRSRRGELRPNERLVEADLAERLSVSRTPIRESIQRLAADGLVVNRRSAWFVREHTPDEITAPLRGAGGARGLRRRTRRGRATPDERAASSSSLSRADL